MELLLEGKAVSENIKKDFEAKKEKQEILESYAIK